MSPFFAEFIGTAILILLGGGVVANVALAKTNGNNSGWIVISTGWALAVYVPVVITSPYSGAHLNPAVTIGLALAEKFPWQETPTYILAQLIGAMVGSFLVWVIYKKHFLCTEDPETIKSVFCTAPAIRSSFSNLFSEIIGTFVLVFSVLYFTNATLIESNQIIGLGSLGALPVAFVVWSIGLSLGGTTGYAINPARDLGPRIVHALIPMKNKAPSDWNYAIIPIIGPVLGAALAAFLMIAINS